MARTKSVIRAARRESGRKVPDSRTTDSFQNFYARLGTSTDNQAALGTMGFNPITRNRQILEWGYRGSWICRKAIDIIPEDMTRAGFDLGSDMKPDQADLIHTAFGVKYQLWKKLNEAMKWARLYGGSIAVILIDGQNPKDPLKLETIQKGQFCGLGVLDRWLVEPSLSDLVSDLKSINLGKPKYYRVNADAPVCARETIHNSRVLRFEGADVPYYQRLSEYLWGVSVLEPIWDRILAFDSTTTGVAQLVYKAHMRVLKMSGLREILATDGKLRDALFEQVDLMRRYQGIEGITILDSEDDFQSLQYTFGGLDGVLIQMGQQLGGALDFPLVRLFGQSPAGLNSTGESDFRHYYDGINSKQNNDFRPQLTPLLQVVGKSEGIEIPNNFNYEFTSLWQMTNNEKAQVGATVTSSVLSAYGEQVIDRATALKELRSISKHTGMWTNITDEQIKEAEQEPPVPNIEEPPTPDQFLPGNNKQEQAQPELEQQDEKKNFLPGENKVTHFKRDGTGGFIFGELEKQDEKIHKPLIHLYVDESGDN